MAESQEIFASSSPLPAQPPLRQPWLIAAWPGMGGVAAIAATYLVEKLGAQPAGALPEREFFSVDHVDVENGIARAGRLPRSMFFTWRDPQGRRDLLLFVGEAQPTSNGDVMCRRIMDVAQAHGVEQVITFAAMATALHPQAQPRVFGAVTAPEHLEKMRRQGVELLREGQVGGLNGALLAAAAERGIPAACLLGEVPFFAASVPNPKASLAALEAFSRLGGVSLELGQLREQAEAIEPQLLGLLEQLRRQTGQMIVGDVGGAEEREPAEPLDLSPEEDEETAPPAREKRKKKKGASSARPVLDEAVRQRLEELFEAARSDRSRAVELKAELDRLGIFPEYEDRFLDLFRKTG